MSTEYVVIHSEAKIAKIFEKSKEKGVLRKVEKASGVFELKSKETEEDWTLTHKVDGEVRPFSIACYSDTDHGHLTFKIKDHTFYHKSNFYSVGGVIPMDASPRDFLTGTKYITRLVNFPFSRVDDIDIETRHRMRKLRGIVAGEITGLGADGYHVKISDDMLKDIGLPLTAATYLLYTTR